MSEHVLCRDQGIVCFQVSWVRSSGRGEHAAQVETGQRGFRCRWEEAPPLTCFLQCFRVQLRGLWGTLRP